MLSVCATAVEGKRERHHMWNVWRRKVCDRLGCVITNTSRICTWQCYNMNIRDSRRSSLLSSRDTFLRLSSSSSTSFWSTLRWWIVRRWLIHSWPMIHARLQIIMLFDIRRARSHCWIVQPLSWQHQLMLRLGFLGTVLLVMDFNLLWIILTVVPLAFLYKQPSEAVAICKLLFNIFA